MTTMVPPPMEPELQVPEENLAPPPQEPTPPSPEVNEVSTGSTIELDDDEKKALKYIFETITMPDDTIRQRMVPIWQSYENYWRGLQDVVYDPSTQAFLSAAGILQKAGELEDNYIGSKVANIYKAHGESIASAISVGNPTVSFYPEDADDPRDITTAKTYTVASEYIADDNDSKLLLLRALYTRWNQPFTAFYNTYIYDEKLGVIQKKEYSLEEMESQEAYCPQCGEDLPVQTPNAICPECGVEANTETTTQQVPVVKSITEVPKGREVIEVYGPRNVRVPYNVKDIGGCPYLILETEHHWTQLLDTFPNAETFLKAGGPTDGDTEDLARRSRLAGEGPEPDLDQRTLYRCWFRSWTFHLIEDEQVRIGLKAKFPDGVQCTFIDKEFVEAFNEGMDEHWTLMPDPYAEHIHGDPLGKPLIPIQDMTNDTLQLTEETILYAIPELFADPNVLDFKKYKNTEKAPGLTYPAKKPAGAGLDSGFFQSRATVLSDNVEIFRQALDSIGQFLTGDFPGVHGGPLPAGSSRTADEYRQAKQSALQRLSVLWVMVNIAWSELMKKSVDDMRLHMQYQGEDVKFVKKNGNAFQNVWIKLSDITEGKIGRVRAEASEEFPLTTEQQRGVLIELLQTQLPELTQFIFAPENIGEASRVLVGLNRFKVPGEVDRDYQLWEIQNMVTGAPAEVVPEIDNHAIHIAILKNWLSSEEGRRIKDSNPQAYQMIVQHLQQHMMIMQAQMQQEQLTQANNSLQPGVRGKPGRAQSTGAAEPTSPVNKGQ